MPTQAEAVLASPWSELIDLPPSAASALKPPVPSRELPKAEDLQVACVGPPCSFMQAAQIRSRLLLQRAKAAACRRVLQGVLQAQAAPQQEECSASSGTKEGKSSVKPSGKASIKGGSASTGKEMCLETPLDGNNNHQGVVFDVIALEASQPPHRVGVGDPQGE